MKDYTKHFAPFGDKIWLNAASEGPLPIIAASSLKASIEWKSKPWDLNNEKFGSVPKYLKQSIGDLIGVNSRDVILANSASYGIHLFADGLEWQKGDEILLMENDFPTDILPWLALEEKGVIVKQIKPKNYVLEPSELASHISKNTKLLCLPHVHTFSGYILDIPGFVDICKENNIIFILNISQSVGSMPVNISALDVDAVVTAGYKWLCGPYATGFAWIKPEIRDQLKVNRAYWSSLLSDEELKPEGPLKFKNLKTARKYDIFAPANFFNFVPFRSSIDLMMDIGLENIFSHNQALVDYFLKKLGAQFELISPRKGKQRSCLTVFSHKDPKNNPEIYKALLEKGIYPALWKNKIRVAAHIYNTTRDMDRLRNELNRIKP